VLLGRREHVEDAAAHGEVAALLHQLRPRVPDLDQPGHYVVEVGGAVLAQPDRLELAQAADHGLEQAAHRGGDDGERPGPWAGRVRVSEPAQHREPLARGVGARREPLVRERLPRREVGGRVLGQQ